MSDTSTPPPGDGPEKPPQGPSDIRPIQIEEEMKRSYLDYAMSVIVSRALPDLVAPRLPDALRERLGSLGWHTTTVKLELEVRGTIRAVTGSRPQVVRRGA